MYKHTCVCYTISSAELHTLVTDLGGEFRWSYDSSCTHYIYKGKKSDFSKVKELKPVKKDGCIIVSPQWIYSVSVCMHVHVVHCS